MTCEPYQQFDYCYLEKDYQAIPPAALEHINACAECRERIGRLCAAMAAAPQMTARTERHLALHFRWLGRRVDCQIVKPFLPAMAMASLAVRVETPITAHLAACPACQADAEHLAALHLSNAQLLEACRTLAGETSQPDTLDPCAKQTLESIRLRPSSGVVTSAVFSEAKDALQVRVVRPAKTAVRLKPAWRAAVTGIAATLMLAAALVWMRLPSATALDMRQFYTALTGVANLSVRTLDAEDQSLLQHIYVSQLLGLRLFESPRKTVLCDTHTGRVVSQEMTLGTPQVFSENPQMPETLLPPWGLLPFHDVTQIPAGYSWQCVDSSDEQTLVYELSWTENMSNSRLIEKVWRGYLDRKTHLPNTIEWYERLDAGQDYELLMVMEITYPDSETVLKAVRQSGLKF